MSHELRTPLNAILGFARMLGRDQSISAHQNEMVSIINRSGEHLLGMLDEVLSLSAIESGQIELNPEAFNLVQMLEDVGLMTQSRAEGKGLQFHLELDPDLAPWLQGDSGKLRQVLINLLGNAVKYTPAGEIWLRARTQPLADDPTRVRLRLEVADTGPGIPADQVEKIFETFVRYEAEQSTEKGTGLGLSISKALVEVMGGQISLESELGQGSNFIVELPLLLAKSDQALAQETPPPEVIGLQDAGAEWRILVVDDNLENRLLLGNLLIQTGFTVQQAQDGAEAVAKFQEWSPHFIWMDIRMPGMDGYQATREIRRLPEGDQVKIVAITASVLAEQHEEIMAAGCDALVRKPFRDQQIFEMLAVQLGLAYRYQEDQPAAEKPREVTLTSEMLAGLPPEILQELDQATLALDRAASLAVIERIAAQSPEIAEALRDIDAEFPNRAYPRIDPGNEKIKIGVFKNRFETYF